MRPSDIYEQMKSRPFVPLRLHFSDGSEFDVRHPELLIVTRTVLALTIMGPPGNKLPERVILLDPVHLLRLEPINGDIQRSA